MHYIAIVAFLALVNRPPQSFGRSKPNRHVLNRQPVGYYDQVIPAKHLHSAARKRREMKELALSQ